LTSAGSIDGGTAYTDGSYTYRKYTSTGTISVTVS
jgi:hypothetical protein